LHKPNPVVSSAGEPADSPPIKLAFGMTRNENIERSKPKYKAGLAHFLLEGVGLLWFEGKFSYGQEQQS
jgi:hypothetical protein